MKQAKILLTITEPCLNPEFPQESTEKLPCSEYLRISPWSYDMEVHAKKCVERYCELANKTTQQLHKEATPCFENQWTKQREQGSLGDCWQWEANEQSSKGDNCSFRHDLNKLAKSRQPNPSPNSFMRQNEKPEVPEARVPVEECFDCTARIISKELAQLHSVKSGTL